VLFIAFAGEEIGLLGSSDFANHPTVPLEGIDAMINMDFGPDVDDRLFHRRRRHLTKALSRRGKTSTTVGLALNFSDSGYGSSDHTSFNAKKIPVLFFFSGLHTDYHKPSDTADKINAEAAIKGGCPLCTGRGPVGHGRAAPALSRNCAAPAGRRGQWRRLRPLFRLGSRFPRRPQRRPVQRCPEQQSGGESGP